MSNTNSYPHGTFSWADLSTTDAAAAKTFYTSLFGWTPVDNPIPGGGVYTMLQLDGKDVVALSQMGEEQQSQGMPSMWNSYITVDDVDAAAAQVEGLGGKVMMPAFDVMEAGRMAMIQGPTGEMVMMWQGNMHKGAGVFNIPNTMGWNELATRDTAAAKAFYTSLFGWSTETDGSGYTMWTNKGRGNGGMMQMDENWGDVPPHWTVYFSVADCAAAAEKLKELGGNVMMGPFPAEGVGTIAIVQDPQGASFNIIQLNNPDTTLP